MNAINVENILDEILNIRELITRRDVNIMKVQISLLERIATRFFENSAYREDLLFPKQRVGAYLHFKDQAQEWQVNEAADEVITIADVMISELKLFGIPTEKDPIIQSPIDL